MQTIMKRFKIKGEMMILSLMMMATVTEILAVKYGKQQREKRMAVKRREES